MLAVYEMVWAASEVISTEAQPLLAAQPAVPGWVFKGNVPCTYDTTDVTKWVALSHTWLEQEITTAQGSWKLSWSGLKVKISDYHQRRWRRSKRYHMLRRCHHIISYLKIKSNTLSSLTHSICIVGINWKCESCYMDSYAISCRNN